MSKSRGNQPNLLPGVDPETDCQAAEDDSSGGIRGEAAVESQGEEQDHDHAHDFSWSDLESESDQSLDLISSLGAGTGRLAAISGTHCVGD